MTQEELNALRAAADKASPGWDGAQLSVGHNPIHAANVADYLVAAHPAAVLALLDERDRLRAALSEIDRLGSLVAHDLQGRVEAGKIMAVQRMADDARAALAESGA